VSINHPKTGLGEIRYFGLWGRVGPWVRWFADSAETQTFSPIVSRDGANHPRDVCLFARELFFRAIPVNQVCGFVKTILIIELVLQLKSIPIT
jgi:hypothetical protein